MWWYCDPCPAKQNASGRDGDRETMGAALVSDPVGGRFLSHGPASPGKPLVEVDRVAAWFLPLAEIAEADWPWLDSLLSPEERARAARFHFDRDRFVYTAAHALVRGLLSYCTGLPAKDWRFSVEDHGKPELMAPAGMPRLRVNLSHTRGLAAVALTVDHDIGVDVEWLQRSVETTSLAGRVLSDSERRVLAAAPEAAQVETFLTFWTLKEAYVKAIGKGLSQPLDAFSFDLDTLSIAFGEDAADIAALWHFRALRPSAEHVMAIAVHHPDPARLAVDIEPAPLAYLRTLAGRSAAGGGRIVRR